MQLLIGEEHKKTENVESVNKTESQLKYLN